MRYARLALRFFLIMLFLLLAFACGFSFFACFEDIRSFWPLAVGYVFVGLLSLGLVVALLFRKDSPRADKGGS